MDEFEYASFLITYLPDTGSYRIVSLDYGHLIGHANIDEGPGAVIIFDTSTKGQPFLDAFDAKAIGSFLDDLNASRTC